MSDPDLNSDLLLWDLQQWGDSTIDCPCGELPKRIPPLLPNSNSTATPPDFHGSPAPEKLFPKRTGGEVRPKESALKSSKLPVSGSEHEVHIFTERERRKKMRSMFSNLHALLPHLPPKESFVYAIKLLGHHRFETNGKSQMRRVVKLWQRPMRALA